MRTNPNREIRVPELSCKHIVVLVVDDVQIVRMALSRILSRHFCVVEADSGLEALEIAHRSDQRLDILLTDVRMPGMNGAVLGEHMRMLRPDVERIYMSGGLGGVVLEPNATLLQKPVDMPALISLLRARVAATSLSG